MDSKTKCQHPNLKLTVEVTNGGHPIYYCADKCGAGLFIVKPLEITVSYGKPPAEAPDAAK